MIVAERNGALLRHARPTDFPQQFAHVDTGLDPAHDAARRAYESVGFDRQVPIVEYWQDLGQLNRGSTAK